MSGEDMQGYIDMGGQKLMVPFLVFSILGHIVDLIHKFMIGELQRYDFVWIPTKNILSLGALYGNLPLWFLPTLLAVQLLYACMRRKIRYECICLISILIAFLTYKMGWHKPLYVGNIALGLFVYTIGYRLRETQYRNTLFVVSLVIFIIIYFSQLVMIDFRQNVLSSGNYLLAVAFGLTGCVVINNLFLRFPLHSRMLEYVGIRSMRFYVMHWILLCVCSWTLNLSGWYLFGSMIVSCMIVLPIVEKMIAYFRLEWIFGIHKNTNGK